MKLTPQTIHLRTKQGIGLSFNLADSPRSNRTWFGESTGSDLQDSPEGTAKQPRNIEDDRFLWAGKEWPSWRTLRKVGSGCRELTRVGEDRERSDTIRKGDGWLTWVGEVGQG